MKRDKPLECGVRSAECGKQKGKYFHSAFRTPHSAFERGFTLLGRQRCLSSLKSTNIKFVVYPNDSKGFTLLEVIVALAIVGISLGVYMSLIGTSFRLKGKVDDHAKKVLLAIQKAEEAHLGLLGDKYASGDNKRVWEGVTEDGVVWKVLESDRKDIAEKNKPVDGITFYDVAAGGVNISSIRSENILAQSPLEQQTSDKKTESKVGSTFSKER